MNPEICTMQDQDKTKSQLIEELAQLRQRVVELEDHGAYVALKESEHRYRTLAESTTDIIYILDNTGKLLYTNQTAARYMGVSPGSLLGKTQDDLFPPEQVPEHLKNIRKVFETGQMLEHEQLYRFGPREVWLNVRIIPLRDDQGRITSAMGVCRNITERKQAAAALKKAYSELEERVDERTAELHKANEELAIFRRFAEASSQGFGMADLDGRIAYVNPALWKMSGEPSPQDCIGKPLVAYLPKNYRERREKEILPAMQQKGHWQGEETIVLADGTNIPTIFTAFPVLDESGSLLRTAVVITDITERKRAEEALKREYRIARQLLQASDHERQIIAYEIHDGLAQQLTGAIMQFETYHHSKDRRPGEAAKAYEAGLTMLRQSQFEARRLIAGVRPPILDEAGVVEAVAHLVHEHSRSGGPRIDFHSTIQFGRLAPTLENAIYRIAQEGLANACRHSKSETVRVSLLQRDDRVRVEIRDWGVGFDANAPREIGFGLEGIEQRARLLDGRYSLHSKIGQGTCIRVELPLMA